VEKTGAKRFAVESRKPREEKAPRGPEPLLIGPIFAGRVPGRNPRSRYFAHGAFSHVPPRCTLLRGCSGSRSRRNSDRSVSLLPRVRDCRWGNALAVFVALLLCPPDSFGTKSLAFRRQFLVYAQARPRPRQSAPQAPGNAGADRRTRTADLLIANLARPFRIASGPLVALWHLVGLGIPEGCDDLILQDLPRPAVHGVVALGSDGPRAHLLPPTPEEEVGLLLLLGNA